MASIELATTYSIEYGAPALQDTIVAIIHDYPEVEFEVIHPGGTTSIEGGWPIVKYTGCKADLIMMCFEEYGMAPSDTTQWMKS